MAALAAALVVAAGRPGAPATTRQTSTCAEDDPVPTPPHYDGWERSSAVAWEAVEQHGGVVPEIEEDRTQAPPGWWRYPSPLRSADLLADEANSAKGLYSRVTDDDLKPGDVLVRTRGVGACGKMAVIAGSVEGDWVTLEADGDHDTTRHANPDFFAGRALRPEAAAYRIRVRKDNSLGHAREIDRDLTHLERTIAERPPLVASRGHDVVDEKVHDLLDEAWSLAADPAFEDERRALAGRALALAAALDWPAAAEEAAAVLDGVLGKTPLRVDAILARASVMLLGGETERALTLAEAAAAIPDAPPRAQYLTGRALLAGGRTADGLQAIRRYLDADPGDPRARKLVASGGREPALAPPPAPITDVDGGALKLSATPERGAVHSAAYGFDVQWPLTWRVVGHAATPDSGLLFDFATERVLRTDGEAERATAVLLAQRPAPPELAALARKGGRNMFPSAKLKPLTPLLPGSRREHFRERAEGAVHEGEITTLARGGTIFFLVLNAGPESYPKLKDEYASFVKSLRAPGGAPK